MFSTWALATVLSIPTVAVQHDTFTFDNTDWKNHVYGPEDWINVQCHDITDCVRTLGDAATIYVLTILTTAVPSLQRDFAVLADELGELP